MSQTSFLKTLTEKHGIETIFHWSNFRPVSNRIDDIRYDTESRLDVWYTTDYDREAWVRQVTEKHQSKLYQIRNQRGTATYFMDWAKLYLKSAVRLTSLGVFDRKHMPTFEMRVKSKTDCIDAMYALQSRFKILGLNLMIGTGGSTEMAYRFESDPDPEMPGHCQLWIGDFNSSTL